MNDQGLAPGFWLAWAALLCLLAGGCCGDCAPEDSKRLLEFDFQGGDLGWEAGFADFQAGQEAAALFVAEHRGLPAPLGPSRAGLYISAMNISDDLAVFFKKKLEGLEPGRAYRLSFDMDIVTNQPRGCGVGTGASTWIKAGGSPNEPVRVTDGGGYVRLNLGFGLQSNESKDVLILGDMRNLHDDCSDGSYGAKSLATGSRFIEETASASGELWLIFGADSGFETPFHLYFTRFRVQLEPL